MWSTGPVSAVGLSSFRSETGTLTTDDGHTLFARRCADGVTAGERGLAAVRPENLKLLRNEPEAQGNKIQGSIIAIAMLGDTLEFVLQAETGEEYIARLPRSAEMHLSEGESVWMHWLAEHMTLFPFEQLSSRAHGGAQETKIDLDEG